MGNMKINKKINSKNKNKIFYTTLIFGFLLNIYSTYEYFSIKQEKYQLYEQYAMTLNHRKNNIDWSKFPINGNENKFNLMKTEFQNYIQNNQNLGKTANQMYKNMNDYVETHHDGVYLFFMCFSLFLLALSFAINKLLEKYVQNEELEQVKLELSNLQFECLDLQTKLNNFDEKDFTTLLTVSDGLVGLISDKFNKILENINDLLQNEKIELGQLSIQSGYLKKISEEVLTKYTEVNPKSVYKDIHNVLGALNNNQVRLQENIDNLKKLETIKKDLDNEDDFQHYLAVLKEQYNLQNNLIQNILEMMRQHKNSLQEMDDIFEQIIVLNMNAALSNQSVNNNSIKLFISEIEELSNLSKSKLKHIIDSSGKYDIKINELLNKINSSRLTDGFTGYHDKSNKMMDVLMSNQIEIKKQGDDLQKGINEQKNMIKSLQDSQENLHVIINLMEDKLQDNLNGATVLQENVKALDKKLNLWKTNS